jgi:hypothetical protein
MIKIIDNSWNFGDSPIQVIRRTGPGLTKQAKWYVEYKSEPGKTFANALFLGATEFYGPNRNADGFLEDELVNHYKSFLSGHHYKHHQNDDPTNSYGDIVEVFYNPDMHRVEGIIKIDNDRSPEMVKRIAAGEPVPLSMACRVKYDICNYCGHKSSTVDQYCDDLKYHKLEIMPNGIQVYAQNPKPEFFDISEVAKGADPTAFTLRKVASYESLPQEYLDRITLSFFKSSSVDKESVLKRLAEIEKELTGLITRRDPETIMLAKAVDDQPLDSKVVTTAMVENLSKTGSFFKNSDLGLTGRVYAFNALLEHPEYLTKISGMSNEKISLNNQILFDRILDNRYKSISFYDNTIATTDPRTVKLGALNLSIFLSNPELLKNRLYTKLAVLGSMLK